MKFPAWVRKAAAPAIAVFDNPILIKELRAGMRGARYFVAFLVILSILAAVILTVFAVSSTSMHPEPTEIGASVFGIAFLLNLVVAFLVVPSFGATAITAERERMTIDTLMSTTLSAHQIVWGKLLGSLAQVSAIFVSTIPIVGLTFLFGGVTVRQMVASYMSLLAICLLLSAWAISVSASSQTSQRAVASAYAGSILVFFLMWGLWAAILASRVGLVVAETYGFLTPEMRYIGSRYWWSAPVDTWTRILYVYLVPLYAYLSFLVLLLLNAASRLKSAFDQKSPPFRIYYAAVTAIGFALAWGVFLNDVASEGAQARMVFLITMSFLSFLACSVSCIFAAETAVTPPHVLQKYEALKGLRRWRWILAPGAPYGIYFCLGINLLLAVAAVVLFLPHTTGFDTGSWAGHLPFVPLLRAVTAVLAWVILLSGLCAWLAAVIPGRPRTIGVICVVFAVAVSAIPMIHWSVAAADAQRDAWQWTSARPEFPGPFTLVLSPVAAIWTSLMTHHDGLRHLPLDFRIFGAELPLHASQAILFLAGGGLLHLRAARRRRLLSKAAA